jgi:hypothetical protein
MTWFSFHGDKLFTVSLVLCAKTPINAKAHIVRPFCKHGHTFLIIELVGAIYYLIQVVLLLEKENLRAGKEYGCRFESRSKRTLLFFCGCRNITSN